MQYAMAGFDSNEWYGQQAVLCGLSVCQTIVHLVRTERDLGMAQGFGTCIAISLEPARPLLLRKVAPERRDTPDPDTFKRDR